MKGLLFLLGISIVAFLVADVVAENTAESRVEDRLASSVEGAAGLEVDVGGGLFLPQIFSGGFEEIVVSIDSIRRGGLVVDDVQIRLREVAFSLGDLLEDEGDVTVGGGRGRAVISQRSLDAALRRADVEAEIELDMGATVTAQGVSAAVDEITISDSGAVSFAAPPLEPLRLQLPATLESVRYSGVSVTGDHLRVSLVVSKGRVDL